MGLKFYERKLLCFSILIWILSNILRTLCIPFFQNADDNSYPAEPGVVPALAFMVERDCITVLNNETGFQEKNIRAICDVGRSTKGKHKYGYIGNSFILPPLQLCKGI